MALSLRCGVKMARPRSATATPPMTGLVWCKGKTTKANGVNLKWEDLALLCASDDSLAAAIKAAQSGK